MDYALSHFYGNLSIIASVRNYEYGKRETANVP